jgi:hypothetical protein
VDLRVKSVISERVLGIFLEHDSFCTTTFST